MSATPLAGIRVLVVEDEWLVSHYIEDILIGEKCLVVGPFDRVPPALEAARTAQIDVALLDVNVAGVKSYPVAEVLATRGIPFLFVSGYGRDAVPADRPHWRVCTKPFRRRDLIGVLVDQLQGR